ncbi:hypothetical protein T4D_14640 [Trichinella pseudospiralis]|uniref:Integrase catalytic domain-containing protein n=1 Tax=Trichinella pseudospiralis TaxID=6337 RepID=A0A0V1FTH7_TRIPS|nr:hypothetical protein T4D_14640 [Trichinella pseudospiralis]
MRTATLSDHRYIMTLIEDYSGFTAVYCLKLCIESKTVLLHCIRKWKNQRLKNFLRQKGTAHQFLANHTPQQNAVAERKNRSLVEMAKVFSRHHLSTELECQTQPRPRTNFWIQSMVLHPKTKAHKCQAKGAIERSREYEDTPKLLKKEDNVNMVDVHRPQQQEPSDEGEPIKNT